VSGSSPVRREILSPKMIRAALAISRPGGSFSLCLVEAAQAYFFFFLAFLGAFFAAFFLATVRPPKKLGEI